MGGGLGVRHNAPGRQLVLRSLAVDIAWKVQGNDQEYDAITEGCGTCFLECNLFLKDKRIAVHVTGLTDGAEVVILKRRPPSTPLKRIFSICGTHFY
jgi:hypothetical protein